MTYPAATYSVQPTRTPASETVFVKVASSEGHAMFWLSREEAAGFGRELLDAAQWLESNEPGGSREEASPGSSTDGG